MIEHLIRKSQEFDQYKNDYGPAPVQTNFIMEDVYGHLVYSPDLNNSKGGLPMTDWAFRQMCGRLGPVAMGGTRSLPATYLQSCPSRLRARNVNHWIKKTPNDRKWFVREYKDEIRAVLTDRYSTVDITETLEWINEALISGNQTDVQLVNPVVTPNVLHLRVLFQNINTGNNGDADYAVGGYFTNGETGNRRMGVYPLVQKHSCTNSIVIPHDDFSWDHIHVGRRQLLKRTFIDSIFFVLEGAVSALDKLLGLQDPLPDFTEHVDNLVQRRGWTVETRDKIMIGTEGHESLFGLIQGVSSAANSVEDPDEAADMQIEAGRILIKSR